MKSISRMVIAVAMLSSLPGLAAECNRSNVIGSLHKVLNEGHDHTVVPYLYLGDDDTFGVALKMSAGQSESAQKAVERRLLAAINELCPGRDVSNDDFGDSRTVGELVEKLGAR